MINDLKDLKKVIKMCQDMGVSSFRFQDIEFQLREKTHQNKPSISLDAFPEAHIPVPTYNPISVQETSDQPIETIAMPDELTEEQLMFYSAKAEAQ